MASRDNRHNAFPAPETPKVLATTRSMSRSGVESRRTRDAASALSWIRESGDATRDVLLNFKWILKRRYSGGIQGASTRDSTTGKGPYSNPS